MYPSRLIPDDFLFHEVAEDVEGGEDVGFGDSAVNQHATRGCKESKVNLIGGVILLVMVHKLYKRGIVLAGDVGCAIALLLEIVGIAIEFRRGEGFGCV